MDGLEFYFTVDGKFLGQGKNGGSQIRVATDYEVYDGIVNGKRERGIRFLKYKDIDKVDPAIAGKVYEDIFRKEIGNEVKEISVINATDRPTLSAATKSKGNFVINKAATEDDELLNSNYYNVSSTLSHENKHSISFPKRTSDSFSHFNIEKGVAEQFGPFKNTSDKYKSHVKELMGNYLTDQEGALQNMIFDVQKGKSTREGLDYYSKEYDNNLKYFNEKYG